MTIWWAGYGHKRRPVGWGRGCGRGNGVATGHSITGLEGKGISHCREQIGQGQLMGYSYGRVGYPALVKQTPIRFKLGQEFEVAPAVESRILTQIAA